jgi:hypothetical protein
MGADSCPKHPIAKRKRQNRDILLIHEPLRRLNTNSARLSLISDHCVSEFCNCYPVGSNVLTISAQQLAVLGAIVPGTTLAASSKTQSARFERS